MSLQFNPQSMKETIDFLTNIAENTPKPAKFQKRSTVQTNSGYAKALNNKENIAKIAENVTIPRRPSVYSSRNSMALLLKTVKNSQKSAFFRFFLFMKKIAFFQFLHFSRFFQ